MTRVRKTYLYSVREIELGNITINVVEKDYFNKHKTLNGSPDDFYYDFIEEYLPMFPELCESVLEVPTDIFENVDAVKEYLKDIPRLEYCEELEKL